MIQGISRFLALFVVVALSAGVHAAEPEVATKADEYVPPADWPQGYYARIETDLGRIVARLLPEQAPQSVAHFVAMARGELEWVDPVTGETREGRYYDGIPIHNVRAGRTFEAGDWTGTGKGAPPIHVPDEGFGPVNFSQAGRLGMARPAAYVSAVQFFATYSAMPELNRNFPCFGAIVEGRETVLRISQLKTYNNGKPIDPPHIRTVEIFTIGNPLPLPEPRQVPQGPVELKLRKDRKKSR